MASVRYIANDLDRCVSFYRDRLGFSVEKHNPGKFAELTREDLHLFLNAPGAGSAGKAGGHPQPGGWNRFMIVTDDLDGMIGDLRQAGESFRGEVAEAERGGRSCSRIHREMSSSCSSTRNTDSDLPTCPSAAPMVMNVAS